MQQYILDRLKSLFTSIWPAFAEPGESTSETMESRFKQIALEFNAVAITYCLDLYIGAELDYAAPGSRGIGRMTTNIPRFGAYFSKPLSKLSSQELDELYFLIRDLCLRGYLMSAILMEWPARHAKLSNGASLFEEWISSIYVINPHELDPDIWDIIKIDAMYTIIEIHVFMRKHGMEGDTLFNRVGRFLSGDKVDEILLYYAIAGYSLRAVQKGWY